MADRGRLSVIVLAGGESTRMGSDKAFLWLSGRTFISAVVSEMLKVSTDVVVMIGPKEPEDYSFLARTGVRVFRDEPYVSNPLGGILAGLGRVAGQFAAVVACDVPMVKAGVIEYLFRSIGTHSAAVPTWEAGDRSLMEPLCAVYRVDKARKGAASALNDRRASVTQMVLRIRDVEYVDVSRLSPFDPTLDSFADIDTPEQYRALQERLNSAPSAKVRRSASGR